MRSLHKLSIRNLAFKFTEGDVLFANINLDVVSGKTVVLFGDNGSGKSTLLKCIAGIEKSSSGEILIDDRESYRSASIGLVMQNPEHQTIAPTVEEEIALGLEFRGVDPVLIREAVEEQIQKFSLTDLRKASPDSLSGGQMQRVALAAILVTDPEFLLLDEPDSLLDAPSRKDFLKAVRCVDDTQGILWTCADSARLPNADAFYYLNSGQLKEVSREQLEEMH